MLNLQLAHLNRSRLDRLGRGGLYLRLEPLVLRRKRLAELRPGDWLDLGAEVPGLELARDGVRLASLRAEAEGVRILDEVADGEPEIPERRDVLLEARVAPLPRVGTLVPGTLFSLDWRLNERIYLYVGEVLLAVARLVAYEEGYALKIEEVADG